MLLAVIHHRLDVHHRVPGHRAGFQRLAHALLGGGDERLGDGAADDLGGEFKARSALQRLHAQVYFRELPGAAGLLLVAVDG